MVTTSWPQGSLRSGPQSHSAKQPPTLPPSHPPTLSLHQSPPQASSTSIGLALPVLSFSLSKSYLAHSAQQLHVVTPAPPLHKHPRTKSATLRTSFKKSLFGPQLWPSKPLSLSTFTLVLLPYCISRAMFGQQL